MTMKDHPRIWPYLGLFVLSVAAIMLLRWGCNEREHRLANAAAYQWAYDVIEHSKDSLTASISVIRTEREKDFLKMRTSDSLVQRLQSEVKAYRGRIASATVMVQHTTDQGATPTTAQLPEVDSSTAKVLSALPATSWPTYHTAWNDRWGRGSILATRDTIYRDIRLLNEFVITTGRKRRGLFKRDELEITVTNANPNTITTDMRSYAVKERRGRFALSVHAGFGLQYGLLHQRLDLGPQLGVGGSFIIYP
jgi:hypothetical protein